MCRRIELLRFDKFYYLNAINTGEAEMREMLQGPCTAHDLTDSTANGRHRWHAAKRRLLSGQTEEDSVLRP